MEIENKYKPIFTTYYYTDMITVQIPWDLSSDKDIKVWIITEDGNVSICNNWSYENGYLTAYNDWGNWAIMVVRDEKGSVEITQSSEGNIKVSDLVEQFKKDNRILEQLQDLQKRCLIVSGKEELNPLPFKENRANKILTFDENGQPNLSLGIESIKNVDQVEKNTIQIYNNTVDVYEEALSLRNETVEAKESALFFKGQAEQARIEAEQARDEAQEISDPENRIGALQDTTQALQVFKSNSGALHCGDYYCWFGKSSATAQSTANITKSVLFRIVDYDWSKNSTADKSITTLAQVGGYGGYKGFMLDYRGIKLRMLSSFYNKGSDYQLYELFVVYYNTFYKFLKKSVNDFCIVFKTDANSTVVDARLYLNGTLIGSTANTGVAWYENADAFRFNGANNDAFTYKDVCVFNFDVSDTNAPYTLSDYQQGKPIPVECLDTSAEQRALLALENYTIKVGESQKVLDYSGNANDASTVYGTVKGDNDTRISAFVNAITGK